MTEVAVITLLPLVPVLFVSIAIGSAATILAWRQRPEPGATPLVVLLLGQSWWSTCIIFKLRANDLAGKILWTELAWVGVVVIPIAWVMFALEYTGRDQLVRPRYVALLSVVPAITVVLALTGEYHELLFIRPQGVGESGVVEVQQGGIWYWVIAGYTYLLGLFGMIPLLGLVTSDTGPFRGQGLALLVGIMAPWVTNILFLAGAIPTSGLDPTPVAFSLSGVLYLGALTRFRLLGTSPAPNRRARQYLFDRMQEGAIVVDSNGYVVDVNEYVLGVLDVEPPQILGAPASRVIPGYERFPDEGTLSGHLTIGNGDDGRPYDVTVTRVRDIRGTPIGSVITLHDVSKHLRQQQRLAVLNRLLRHNIRTETNVIHGYVDKFADDDEDASVVKDRALRIEEIGRKGREAVQLFDTVGDGHEVSALAALVEQSVETVSERYPEVIIDLDVGRHAEDVQVSRRLAPVLTNLVENAAQHNTGAARHVWVTVRVDDDVVRVEVADDGPGIPEYELEAIHGGVETPLRHGSGMGLWIVQWGVDICGGDVHFEATETGALVTIEVPVGSRERGPGGGQPDSGPTAR